MPKKVYPKTKTNFAYAYCPRVEKYLLVKVGIFIKNMT
jgi:hypothetical protein